MASNGNGKPSKPQMDWEANPRWAGVTRPYSMEDVERLRGSIHIEHTLARPGAERLWNLLHTESYVAALGAMTGNQADPAGQGRAAGDLRERLASGGGCQRRRPNVSRPEPVPGEQRAQSGAAHQSGPDARRPDPSRRRARTACHWFAPLIADAEAGFGGSLNAFELMKAMIEAGVACVHFEDQLSSAKKCGHLGGKVLVPTSEAIQKLVAARLAADVMGVPTLIMARTDADSAHLLTSDIDPRDREFLTGERTPEGFFRIRGGLESAIARGISYAPYADLIWCETSNPTSNEARRFAEAILARYPGKMLAYNCSPSFNWKKNLDDATIARFQTRTRGHGLQIPVHHAGRFPRAEPRHVRAGARLQAERHDRVFPPAGKGIQPRTPVRLRGREAPAICGDGILRRRAAGDRERNFVGDGACGFDRSRAVRADETAGASEAWPSGRGLPADPRRLPFRNLVQLHGPEPGPEESLLPSGD